jgi:hypothetical protein
MTIPVGAAYICTALPLRLPRLHTRHCQSSRHRPAPALALARSPTRTRVRSCMGVIHTMVSRMQVRRAALPPLGRVGVMHRVVRTVTRAAGRRMRHIGVMVRPSGESRRGGNEGGVGTDRHAGRRALVM